MGIDVTYQAIPPHSALLARVRIDPEWGQYLQFLIPYGADDVDEREGDTVTFRAFVAAAQALLRTKPHLRQRRLPLGRRYDQLYYLLAPERRRCEPKRDNPLTQAIFGGAALHPAATTTQGFPIRYLAPTEMAAGRLRQASPLLHARGRSQRGRPHLYGLSSCIARKQLKRSPPASRERCSA